MLVKLQFSGSLPNAVVPSSLTVSPSIVSGMTSSVPEAVQSSIRASPSIVFEYMKSPLMV